VSPVKYELGFYIPEDDILHSDRRENLKSYRMILLKVFLSVPNIRAVSSERSWPQEVMLDPGTAHSPSP
jgi:hypothetical protein